MKIRCPYCGEETKSSGYCEACFKPIGWAEAFWKKSSVYYNEGLKAAKVRNLSLAQCYLTKAVMANKYHIDARNLLGLVYFETGNVSEALKQWIISQSLKKEGNLASQYIQEVQKEYKQLEGFRDAISLYNQALVYLRQDNRDMAMIRLKKAVSLNERFVSAKVLLGLCYMKKKQYRKANEMVIKALQVDQGNPQALRYYFELSKEDTEHIEPYQKDFTRFKPESSKVNPEKVINQGSSFMRYLLYFLLGVGSVMAVYTYLIMPANVESYKAQIAELSESQEQLRTKLEKVSGEYQTKVEDLEATKSDLESKVAAYGEQVDVFTQKEKITTAQKLQEEGNYCEAALELYSVAQSQLGQEDQASYEALKEKIFPEANRQLYNDGLNAYNRGEYPDAVSKFETILLYEPEERMTRRTLYYLACAHMDNGSKDDAVKYFNKLIGEYDGSYEAQQAQRKLEEIAS